MGVVVRWEYTFGNTVQLNEPKSIKKKKQPQQQQKKKCIGGGLRAESLDQELVIGETLGAFRNCIKSLTRK